MTSPNLRIFTAAITSLLFSVAGGWGHGAAAQAAAPSERHAAKSGDRQTAQPIQQEGSPTQQSASPIQQSTSREQRAASPDQQLPSPDQQRSQSSQRQSATPKIDEQFVVGKIQSTTDTSVNSELLQHTGMVSKRQLVRVQIVEGPLKGMTVTIPNELTDNPAFNVSVKPGQEVVLSVSTENGKHAEVNIADYYRAPILGWLLLVFLAVFLFFGGKTGVKSLAGLATTVLLIAFVLLPLSMKGFNPLLTAIFICLISTATSMLFVAGFTKKATASIIGTVGGVIIAGIAAHLVITLAPLTGLSSEEAQILRGSILSQQPPFYSGLLAAGMLIGALGVIMDVGISIASAVTEVAKTGETLNVHKLYESGMNVGRDIMGTMTNTLILAYTGGALPLLLLASQVPSSKLLNLDLVATEIASALSGSLGLVCTIPLTAFAAAKLMANNNNNNNNNNATAPSRRTAASDRTDETASRTDASN